MLSIADHWKEDSLNKTQRERELSKDIEPGFIKLSKIRFLNSLREELKEHTGRLLSFMATNKLNDLSYWVLKDNLESCQKEIARIEKKIKYLRRNKKMFSKRYKMPHAAEERRKALESSYGHLGYRGTVERVPAEAPESEC